MAAAFKDLTMNAEFCEDNSGSGQKMRPFRTNKAGKGGGGQAFRAPPMDPQLVSPNKLSPRL